MILIWFLAFFLFVESGSEPIPLMTGNTCSDVFQKKILEHVNEIRKKQETAPVSLTSNLFQQISAQQIANYYAARSLPYHDPFDSYLQPHFSTIIYGAELTDRKDKKVDPSDFAKYWEHNKDLNLHNYPFYGVEMPGSQNSQIRYHPLTTLLWNSSKHLSIGCAYGYDKATTFGRNYYVVLNFDPPGNQPCEYKRNVLPPKGSLAWEKMKADPNWIRKADYFCIVHAFHQQVVECPAKFINELVGHINRFRTEHSTPPVFHSQNISDYSQKWATYLASRHSELVFHQPQNKYHFDLIYTSQPKADLDALHVFAYWSTVEQYLVPVGKNEVLGDEQPEDHRLGYSIAYALLWKGSREVGFGCSQTVDGAYKVVANFDPPGHSRCEYTHNVLPQKDRERAVWMKEHGDYVVPECAVY